MSEDELIWNLEDFDYSDVDSYEDNFSEYESDNGDYIRDPELGFDEDEDNFSEYESDDGENTWDPEFGFDEERYLFEYDPPFRIHYGSNYPVGSSYQNVFTKTEMLSKLLDAWQNRSKSNLHVEFSDAEYSDLDTNLYQLEEEARAKLRSFSVRNFLEVMGGQEEVDTLKEKIDQTLIITKKVLSSILARCLPMDLPYPALRIILSHLLREEGLHKLGFISSDDDEKVKERCHLSSLEDFIGFFYLCMKKMMFNSFPLVAPISSITTMRDKIKIFEEHLNELSVFAENMDCGEMVG